MDTNARVKAKGVWTSTYGEQQKQEFGVCVCRCPAGPPGAPTLADLHVGMGALAALQT
jgi:hypothetical protein